MVELLVVVSVIALLMIVLLGLADPQRRARRINCVNNIRQIELAFKTWSTDQSDRSPMQKPMKEGGTLELITNGLVYVHLQVMSNELSAPKLVVCPSDKAKTVAESFAPGRFDNGNVSYFVGVDASDTYPQMILLGDRNLTSNDVPVKPGLVSFATNSPLSWTEEIHVGQGNIGLADGSVQQVSPEKLQLRLLGNGTNRWVVP